MPREYWNGVDAKVLTSKWDARISVPIQWRPSPEHELLYKITTFGRQLLIPKYQTFRSYSRTWQCSLHLAPGTAHRGGPLQPPCPLLRYSVDYHPARFKFPLGSCSTCIAMRLSGRDKRSNGPAATQTTTTTNKSCRRGTALQSVRFSLSL